MAESRFITQYDADPEFWQFLNGLKNDDITAELIQNEPDADASLTRIHFGQDRFVERDKVLARLNSPTTEAAVQQLITTGVALFSVAAQMYKDGHLARQNQLQLPRARRN